MKKLLLILLACIALAACKKDKATSGTATPQPLPKTNRELLVAGKWLPEKIEIHEVYNGDTQIISYPLLIDPCQKDDTITYHGSGFKIITKGLVNCSTNEPGIDTIRTWNMLTDNSTEITETDIDTNKVTYLLIEAINEHTLQLALPITNMPGNKNVYIYKNVAE